MKPCVCSTGPTVSDATTAYTGGDHGTCYRCGGAWTLAGVVAKFGRIPTTSTYHPLGTDMKHTRHSTDDPTSALRRLSRFETTLSGGDDPRLVYAEWFERCQRYVEHLEQLPLDRQRREIITLRNVARFFVAYVDRWPGFGSLAALSRSAIADADCDRARNFCEVHDDAFGFYLAHLARQLTLVERHQLFTGLRDPVWIRANRGKL